MTGDGPEAWGSDTALSEQDCRRLLATRTLGRVGLTSGALPVIMPVEYVYDDGVITFRTEHDAKLRAAEQGDVLAFEVDEVADLGANALNPVGDDVVGIE